MSITRTQESEGMKLYNLRKMQKFALNNPHSHMIYLRVTPERSAGG
jgi:hypothetical protein